MWPRESRMKKQDPGTSVSGVLLFWWRWVGGDVPDRRGSLSENRWAGVMFRVFAGVYRGCVDFGFLVGFSESRISNVPVGRLSAECLIRAELPCPVREFMRVSYGSGTSPGSIPAPGCFPTDKLQTIQWLTGKGHPWAMTL